MIDAKSLYRAGRRPQVAARAELLCPLPVGQSTTLAVQRRRALRPIKSVGWRAPAFLFAAGHFAGQQRARGLRGCER